VAAPSKTVIRAIPEAHRRSPLFEATVAIVSAVSKRARIGTMTAATVHASVAGDAVASEPATSHEARARHASATDVRRATWAPDRDTIACSPYTTGCEANDFRGVRGPVAFTYMEVMSRWT
jgi:hypothetical protein